MATKQKSGLYRTKVKIGTNEHGKEIVKWVSGKTRKELEDAKREVVERYIGGHDTKNDRLFSDYASEWFHVRKEPFISASTRNCYSTILNRHLLPNFGDRNLRSFRTVELQTYLNGFAGQSKTQITMIRLALHAIFDAAVADGILDRNPAENLRMPEITPPAEKEALSDQQRARIEALFTTHRYGAYIATMYYTGMRPGEVRGLQWGDIDFKANVIHVQRDVDYAANGKAGALKTRAADRYIPISEALRSILYPRRMASGAFVFPGKDGKPLSSSTAQRMWLELMRDCGMVEAVEDGQKAYYSKGDIRGQYRALITPHAMRHNFITMCWENGIDLFITMKLVGHADYQTTRNIYTHLSRVHLDSAAEELNAMFEKQSCTKVAQAKIVKLASK